MNDERFAGLARSPNMHPKTFTLPSHVSHSAIAQAEIVQPGFTDTNDLGPCGPKQKIIQARLCHAFIVWVNTDTAPKIVITDGQSMDVVKLFQRGANDERTIDLRCLHGFTDLRQLVLKLWINEVAMGVGEHDNQV
jgi:hypothetical protein